MHQQEAPFTCLTCLVLDHTFSKTLKIFFAKIPLFANCHQITYFLWSLEQNGYPGIKHPKASIDDNTDSMSQELAWILFLFFFAIKNVPVYAKISRFFKQKNPLSPDFQKFRLTGLASILVNM